MAFCNPAEVQRGPHINTTAVRLYLHLRTSSAICSGEQRVEQSEIMREARASNSLKLMITQRANERDLSTNCHLTVRQVKEGETLSLFNILFIMF